MMAGEGTRKKSRKKESLSPGEKLRLRQLLICLVLFGVVFVGRGMDLGPVSQLSATVGELVRADTDFQAVFARMGSPSPRENQRWKPSVPSGAGCFPRRKHRPRRRRRGRRRNSRRPRRSRQREARMARKTIHSTGGFWLILGALLLAASFGFCSGRRWRRQCMSWGTWQRCGPWAAGWAAFG